MGIADWFRKRPRRNDPATEAAVYPAALPGDDPHHEGDDRGRGDSGGGFFSGLFGGGDSGGSDSGGVGDGGVGGS